MTTRAQIWTYQDVIDYLADNNTAAVSDALMRTMRRAILRAHRDLPNLTRWSYTERRYILKTTASQTSSTISYDHTGGSVERELTLAAGSWPSNAQYGVVVIDDVHYAVQRAVSSTILQLREDSNPGDDVAAGTSYTYYQKAYPLPVDFLKLHRVYDLDQEKEVRQVSPDREQDQSIHIWDSPDTPWTVTTRGTHDLYNRMMLIFSPPPSSAVNYEISYQAAPRPLRIAKYDTGTVSITGGTATVTGSSTVFPADCEGSIIRLSSNSTTPPTSVVGDLDGNDNPFFAERRILVRGSDTSLTLDANVDTTLSGVKYTISDPIDIDNYSMFTAFLRMCEAEYAMRRGTKNAKSLMEEMYDSISLAKEMDQKVPNIGAGTSYDPFRRPNITQD